MSKELDRFALAIAKMNGFNTVEEYQIWLFNSDTEWGRASRQFARDAAINIALEIDSQLAKEAYKDYLEQNKSR